MSNENIRQNQSDSSAASFKRPSDFCYVSYLKRYSIASNKNFQLTVKSYPNHDLGRSANQLKLLLYALKAAKFAIVHRQLYEPMHNRNLEMNFDVPLS
jgi:hypothetical protein